jgi:hypothetical protein
MVVSFSALFTRLFPRDLPPRPIPVSASESNMKSVRFPRVSVTTKAPTGIIGFDEITGRQGVLA